MACCGGEREKGPISAQQRWDYITLDDFKARGCLTPFSYMWLWILVFTWIGVIVVDTFTAIQLLAFDRWASQVQPKIPFKVSKWIFAGAIIFSFVLLIYEIQRAVRVIKRGGVASSYLDPLAVEWQSARLGKGRGWKRFLVFAELTKSKKGVDYIALFVYFQFKSESSRSCNAICMQTNIFVQPLSVSSLPKDRARSSMPSPSGPCSSSTSSPAARTHQRTVTTGYSSSGRTLRCLQTKTSGRLSSWLLCCTPSSSGLSQPSCWPWQLSSTFFSYGTICRATRVACRNTAKGRSTLVWRRLSARRRVRPWRRQPRRIGRRRDKR